jgi:hypothetical protein
MKDKEVFQQIVDLLNRSLSLIDQNKEIYKNENIDAEDLYYELEKISDTISDEIKIKRYEENK